MYQLEELMSDYSSEGDDSSEEEREDLKEIEKEKKDFSLEKKDEENLQKRIASIKDKGEKRKKGVVYLSRIPHGFYEGQMRKYLSQFGTVTRLKLYRNRKTGKSRHFAFIEFAFEEVAQIVAETMHNYILCDRLLQCKFMPAEKINPYMWVGANKQFKPNSYIKETMQKHNRKRSPEEKMNRIRNLLKKEQIKRKKLEKLGIDFDFPGYTARAKPKSEKRKPKKVEKVEKKSYRNNKSKKGKQSY